MAAAPTFAAPPVIVPSRAPTPAATAPPAAPRGRAPAIADATILSVTESSVTLTWRTGEPASSRIAYGLDAPTLWTPADAPTVEHSATVSGLSYSTTYRLWIQA